MKFSAVILIAIAIAGTARADVNYNIAIGQAKRAVNQTEAASGNQPSAPGQTPAAPTQPPVDPKLQATLQNIGDLKADFDVIVNAADAAAAGDQKISLLNHLSQAAQGGKAASGDVKNLAGDLITALAGRKNLLPQNQKLARSVHALFNGAHLSDAQTETLLAGVKKLLTTGGVTDPDAGKVADDLKAIAAATK
jgi:hypothetical protein